MIKFRELMLRAYLAFQFFEDFWDFKSAIP